MKLYYVPGSPNCRRVVATVHHLGLPIELQTVDFMSPNFDSAAFERLNPNGMVPTLEDGTFTLWESNAIMQYLCEKKGQTDLYPSDMESRADIARWQHWGLAHFGPACSTYIWENILKSLFGAGEPDAGALAEAAEEFARYGAVLDRHLTNRTFLCGKNPTLADYSVASPLMHAQAAKMPWDEFANIKRWYSRIEQLDAWKKSAPPSR